MTIANVFTGMIRCGGDGRSCRWKGNCIFERRFKSSDALVHGESEILQVSLNFWWHAK